MVCSTLVEVGTHSVCAVSALSSIMNLSTFARSGYAILSHDSFTYDDCALLLLLCSVLPSVL